MKLTNRLLSMAAQNFRVSISFSSILHLNLLAGECLAVFCLATYGEGDPTDNAQEFFDWLQSGGGDLSGMKFAVFGLGNKTYEHFNSMAKYVDKRLEELGAKRIHQLG